MKIAGTHKSVTTVPKSAFLSVKVKHVPWEQDVMLEIIGSPVSVSLLSLVMASSSVKSVRTTVFMIKLKHNKCITVHLGFFSCTCSNHTFQT